jgi:ribosomal protein L29
MRDYYKDLKDKTLEELIDRMNELKDGFEFAW